MRPVPHKKGFFSNSFFIYIYLVHLPFFVEKTKKIYMAILVLILRLLKCDSVRKLKVPDPSPATSYMQCWALCNKPPKCPWSGWKWLRRVKELGSPFPIVLRSVNVRERKDVVLSTQYKKWIDCFLQKRFKPPKRRLKS